MAYPPITSLGTVPQRTQTPAEFATNADSFLGALPNFRTELNTFGAYVDTKGAEVDAAAAAAASSALQSQNSASASDASAALALSYKDLAAGTANFKGSWSALAGSLAVPASVYHNGLTWILLSNLANVTTAEPGISASWVVASGESYRRLLDGIFKRATLDLDFSANSHKVYEQFGLEPKQLQSVVVTSRNSTATYQSPTAIATAAINTPRITYDAATGNALGLLAEEQRTNLCLWSEDFTNATWAKTNVTVTGNSTAAPDNASTADKIIENTANGSHEVSQAINMTVGVVNALSVYVKAGERNSVRVAGRSSVNWSSFPSGIFDLVAGTVVSSTGAQPAEITKLQNGWYRCTIYGNPSATAVGIIVGLVQSGTTSSYTGDGTSGLFVWGAQAEVGTAPTSYIPTTTAQVTRVADVISRALTTTNANAGAIFIEFDLTSYDTSSASATVIVKLCDSANTNNRGFGLNLSGNQFALRLRDSVISNSVSITVSNSLLPKKVLISFDLSASQILIAVDGVTSIGSITAGIDLSLFVSHLFVQGGTAMTGSTIQHSKTVKRCTYFPRSFTAAEAQAITA